MLAAWKRFFKWAMLAILAVVMIAIAIDARKISGLDLDPVSVTEYEVYLKGQRYTLKYVPKKNIAPLFGQARNEFGNRIALVRQDLPGSVQDFVKYHEVYHLQDSTHKARLSRELHATLGALPYAPLGFIRTVILSLTDPERIAYYFKFL